MTSQACRARRDLSNGVKNPKPEVDWDRTFVHGTLDVMTHQPWLRDWKVSNWCNVNHLWLASWSTSNWMLIIQAFFVAMSFFLLDRCAYSWCFCTLFGATTEISFRQWTKMMLTSLGEYFLMAKSRMGVHFTQLCCTPIFQHKHFTR